MGRIRKGANGGFSGKAGSVVGSSWRDIDYIRGLPKLSNKPKSEKQLEQQARFALAINVLLPVKKQIDIGFCNIKQGRTTSYNLALKHMLDFAIIGIYPELVIDFSKIAFSQGRLSGVLGTTVLAEPGKIKLNWSTDVLRSTASPADLMTILVYEPESNEYVIGPPDVARSASKVDITSHPIGWD
ncbi:MAG: DUF6266 family protein [Daejeonella sp.]|uniref:DUF6266 family protein n=1 Tax=Daejeonella sp. TaxID=2805397 RepID=UPI003C753129